LIERLGEEFSDPFDKEPAEEERNRGCQKRSDDAVSQLLEMLEEAHPGQFLDRVRRGCRGVR
jgi:hypothetical protein